MPTKQPKPKPRPVGRPKLATHHAKSSIMPVRFNAEDRQRIEETAKEADRSASELTRVLLAPQIGVGDTVSIEGMDGLFTVVAGWPGKARYFVAPEGQQEFTIKWREWVDPDKMTLIRKNRKFLDFRQVR